MPPFTAICVATPATKLTVPEVAPASAGALKPSVRGPTTPVIIRFVKVARPPAPVCTESVPPSTPPPEAITAATGVPLWLTGFPAASWSWTVGCCANRMAFCALAGGCVAIASLAAGPDVSVIGAVIAGVRLAASRESV